MIDWIHGKNSIQSHECGGWYLPVIPRETKVVSALEEISKQGCSKAGLGLGELKEWVVLCWASGQGASETARKDAPETPVTYQIPLNPDAAACFSSANQSSCLMSWQFYLASWPGQGWLDCQWKRGQWHKALRHEKSPASQPASECMCLKLLRTLKISWGWPNLMDGFLN